MREVNFKNCGTEIMLTRFEAEAREEDLISDLVLCFNNITVLDNTTFII